jgi:rod shape determining protein RodA
VSITPIQRPEERGAIRTARVALAFDPLLLAAALGLVAFSFVTLRGAAPSYSHRQLIYAGLGFVAMVIVAAFDYSLLRRIRYVLYGAAVALNVVVLGMPARLGATRWIPLPFFQLQPSEIGKVLLIVAIAAAVAERSRRQHELRTTIRVLLLALLPALLVIAQPDLGTGLVYMTVAVAILYFAGMSWRVMSALGVLAVVGVVGILAVAPALGVHLLKDYQQQRLTTFIDPPTVCHSQKDPTCYQLQQSLIAIGSGEKTGRGVSGATQTKFNFIPEAQNDFIFAVVGETYGFVGAALVLSLYALLIWRTLRIITMAKNLFGSLIAGGILAMFMFQVFVNIGMTIGIMPVTGVPLPLLSYGGSSVLVTFIALGLLESIHIQARMSSAGKSRAPL